MSNEESVVQNRIDIEFAAISAFRDILKLSNAGDHRSSTYKQAQTFGAQVIPELLGKEKSLLWRANESDVLREFRQAAALDSKSGTEVSALELLKQEEARMKSRLENSGPKGYTGSVDQVKNRLKKVQAAIVELASEGESENELIKRDATSLKYQIPELRAERGFVEYQLTDDEVLRVRTFHPDKIEHATGADLVYEKHQPNLELVRMFAVQYKIWANTELYLNEERLKKQLDRLKSFTCDSGLCSGLKNKEFRFPFCAGFLRPTDQLQSPNQKLKSSGLHLPICRLGAASVKGPKNGLKINKDSVLPHAVSGEVFDKLFTENKVGSDSLSYAQLSDHYAKISEQAGNTNLLVHVQVLPRDSFVEN
jgi:hypothetical protein